MKNPHWLSSVYSDGSKNFVSNPLPKKGEKITISIQLRSDAPVKKILLQGKFNGVSHPRAMKKAESEGGLDKWEIELTIWEKELRYFFILVADKALYYYAQDGFSTWIPNEVYLFRILTDYTQPEWVKNAVFYQIFPDRFCNGNEENDVKNGEYIFDGFPSQKISPWEKKPAPYEKAHCLDFYGGDLEGIRSKIPYFKELGITALYLNPIFYAATVHRYDCLDYFHVDPHLGGDAELAKLTDELHKNGIKIILDVSINHTGIANRWFNRDGTFFPKTEGAFNNPESTEREYYFFNADNSYKAWFNVETLPTLNYTSQKLREKLYLSEDSLVKKWLKAPYSTDGWRFDVADTMARNDEIQLHHEVWPEIRKSIKEENPEAYILAEDWSDCSEFLNGDEWDSPMNYYGSCRAVRMFFGQKDIFNGRNPDMKSVNYRMTAKDFISQVSLYLSRLPYTIQQMQFNLLDSHDVPRFHNDKKMNFDKVKGAVTMIFTLPGCTSVYYGDEAEIDGTTTEMEGCRYPMPWSKDIKGTKNWKLYNTLCKIKTTSDCFKDGAFKFLYNEGYTVSWIRFTGEEAYITVSSQERKEKILELPLNMLRDTILSRKVSKTDVFGEEITASINDKTLILKIPAGKTYLIKL